MEELAILRDVIRSLLNIVPRSGRIQYDRELIELRDALGAATREDTPQIVALMQGLASLADHYQRSGHERPLKLDSPYFGHIRINQEGKVRDILIGNGNQLDAHMPYPIADWRESPISRLYYTYRDGDLYEEEIGGNRVSGEILARRTLLVQNGVLEGVQSAEGTFRRSGGQWVKATRPAPTLQAATGDALSAGPNTSRPQDEAGGAERMDKFLPEITALIDSHQFDLITGPESGVIAIDGGAGSGKTTIALHRIAYLTRRYPKRFPPHTVMAVVFNRALARYISHLLPALGVKGVRIEVYEAFVSRLRQRHFPYIVADYAETTPAQVSRFKQHPAALACLTEQAAAWEAGFEKDLTIALTGTESREKVLAAWKSMDAVPLATRLERFTRWAGGRSNLPGLGAFGSDWLGRNRLKRLLHNVLPDPSAPSSLAYAVWDEAFLRLEPLREAMERLAPGEFSAGQLAAVRDWALSALHQRETYRVWREERKGRDAEPGVGSMDDGSTVDPPKLDREDDTLLLHLYRLLIGPLRAGKKRPLRVSHLMVDEAQDFGPLELRLLLDLAREPLSVSLAGDAAQRIALHDGFDSWGVLLRQLGLEGSAITPLEVGYRSTSEIMDFATHILGDQAPQRKWVATRHGPPVELLCFSDVGHAVSIVGEALRHLLRARPSAHVALIARHPEQADVYHQGLIQSDVPRLRRIDDQDFAFEPGVEVTDVQQVKGLEFDYVILLDVDNATYPDEPTSRHLLHVAATRAAHQLWLVACRDPSPLLPDSISDPLE